MEYVENNYAPVIVVVIGLTAKKLTKKELVPVSSWKQMLYTYLTVLGGVVIGGKIKSEIDKRNVVPKPN